MSPHHPFRPCSVGLFTVVLGFGCAESPTTADFGAGSSARLTLAADAPTFVPNAHRYRDGARATAGGRAGNATLRVLSLAGRDGRTEIHLEAGRADGGYPGEIALGNVQLKGYAPDGAQVFTRNVRLETAAAVLHAAGLQPGSPLQVQAVIQGADPARAGVVTVDDVVRRLPDLAIHQAVVPVRAMVNTSPTLRAVVRELNGDHGGVADCVLDVDGVEVDRVHSMWVDAGGTVTCQFFHIFRTTGEHAVGIRLEPRVLGDWDASNHAAAGTIRIDPNSSAFEFDASFDDRTFDEQWRSTWRSSSIDGASGFEEESEYSSTGRTQDAWMSATMPRAVRFPLDRLQIRQSTRDGPVQGFALMNVAADLVWSDGVGTVSCARRTFIPEIGGRGWVEICSYATPSEDQPDAGYTHASYYRNAGDVTYHSRGSSRFWVRDTGYEDVYSWNDVYGDSYGRFATYGFEYGFFLAIDDRGTRYQVSPVVWLAAAARESSSPLACWSWADDWARTEHCWESRLSEQRVSGRVYGLPWSP